ncbi:hypothetical protein BDN71DRAFT_701155 [Pleurotus eryngii]|uniref:Uncharacterized protein n=1 Tax=Pleurotus eryngii TaxID=5323 RepID=A0A9P6DC99_PLEER|nr:hypothetical protein BDN71DRAFT_701155 [Pleurotus eryngii]
MCFINTSLNTSFSVQHEVHNREAQRNTYFDHVSIFTTTLSCAPPLSILPMTYHIIPISLRQTTISPYRSSLHQPPYLRTCTPFPPIHRSDPFFTLNSSSSFSGSASASEPPSSSRGLIDHPRRNRAKGTPLPRKTNFVLSPSRKLTNSWSLRYLCPVHPPIYSLLATFISGVLYLLDALMRPNVYLPGARRTRFGPRTFSIFPAAAKWKYTNRRSTISFIFSYVCFSRAGEQPKIRMGIHDHQHRQ